MIMRRRHLVALGLSLCLLAPAASAQERQGKCAGGACRDVLVYLGTQGSGAGQGIFVARLNEATGTLTPPALAAEVERPTWLLPDPRRGRIFTVSETGNAGERQGQVQSFAVGAAGALKPIGRAGSGGAGPTHLAYDRRSATVFVANYGSGHVGAVAVGGDGSLAPAGSTAAHGGSGPHRRQQGPHAHAVVMDPTGHFVLSPDLGADKVFIHRIGASGAFAPGEPAAAALPAGSGPRHMVFSHSGRFAFVITELSAEIYSFRWDARAGRLSEAGRVALDKPDFTGAHSAAEIALSEDGRFLYASNRAANALQVYAVDERRGSLAEVQRVASGGLNPWSFGIAPGGRWMLVANQGSNSLALFAVDHRTGRLTPTSAGLTVPKPVAIAFMPGAAR
jgi:6-phosphogluconolactonase